jgi:hypothetical protein
MRLLVSAVVVLSGDRCEFDVAAELRELSDEVFASPFGLVLAGEVVGAEFLVGGDVGEDTPTDYEQRVCHRDQRACFAAPFSDALEPDGEGAVLGGDRRPCSLGESGGESRVR